MWRDLQPANLPPPAPLPGAYAAETAVGLFDLAFEVLVAREGGLLADPRRLDAEVTLGDLSFEAAFPGIHAAHSRLNPKQAKPLYRDVCWIPALCDQLPREVALEMFDMAASSGVDAALRALQAALRLTPDGRPGPELKLALRQVDPARLRARFLAARLIDISERLAFAGSAA